MLVRGKLDAMPRWTCCKFKISRLFDEAWLVDTMVSRIILVIFCIHCIKLTSANIIHYPSQAKLSPRVDPRPDGLINGGSAGELHRSAP
jgi:hypothetical protein